MINRQDARKAPFREVRHSIAKADKQYVSGILYRVVVTMVQSTCKNIDENEGKLIDECPAKKPLSTRHCLVTMWSRPWKKEPLKFIVNVKCLHGTEIMVGRGEREEMSIKEVTSNKLLMGGLDKATEMINRQDARKAPFREVRHSIAKADKQYVSGILYRVVVTMVQSTCKNIDENEGKLIDECPAKKPLSTRHCLVTMWSRPWKKEPLKFIVNVKCLHGTEITKSGERQEMSIKEVTSNKILMSGLDKATEMINREDARKTPFREVRQSIVKASKQRVAGIVYRVLVTMAQSTCKNIDENEGKLIDECPARDPLITRHCLVTMWYRPWKKEPFKFIVMVKCLRGNEA